VWIVHIFLVKLYQFKYSDVSPLNCSGIVPQSKSKKYEKKKGKSKMMWPTCSRFCSHQYIHEFCKWRIYRIEQSSCAC